MDIIEKLEKILSEFVPKLKNGGKTKIYIKPKNRGKFTEYCGGKVTPECISKGKNSSNSKIRKRATFAENSRRWRHKDGGTINYDISNILNQWKK